MTDDTLEAISRRRFFARLGSGLAGMALADLLASDAAAESLSRRSARFVHDLAPGPGHFHARAKSVIQLFMHGGPSQVDLLDPKPALARYDGKNFPGVIDVQQPEQAG